jgi:peroxiredoxin
MATNKLKIGSPLPEFNLPAVDGKKYSPSDYNNKKILIVIFSCNHCPYVQAYEERIMNIQKEYGNKGVQIVAISSNDAVKYPEDSFEQMKSRSDEKKFNFPYLYDEDQSIAKSFGATHTPKYLSLMKKENLHIMERLMITGRIKAW